MSDTILDLHRTAMRASLYQQQPDALIGAMEGREMASNYRHFSAIPGGFLSNALVMANAVGAIANGHLRTVVIVDAGLPTGGPAVVSQDAISGGIRIGRGSTDAIDWAQWTQTTKEYLQNPEPVPTPLSSPAARIRVDRLAQIQAAFGFPTLTLAEVLGITRQGLYKWLDATREITLQETSRQRLAVVEQLAARWAGRSSAPLNSVAHEPVNGGRTVLQMLTDAALDETAISQVFDGLVEKLHSKPRSLSQSMANAGFKRRPSAKSLPADE